MRRRSFLAASLASLVTTPAWASSESSFHALDAAGSRIRLTLHAGDLALSRQAVADWRQGCCAAVANWYGGFPVHPLRVELTVGRGVGIYGGVTYGGGAPVIKATIGRDSRLSDLESNWVMVHELVHLACPQVPRDHHWLEEGLSTYIEPWIRVHCRQITAEKAWLDLVEGLPQGQPKAGEEGLDRTHTWGRTYWGGALFALDLDLKLCKASQGDRGLSDVLRGVVAKGQSIRDFRSMDTLMAQWDALAGNPLPSQVYRAHAHAPLQVDLPLIWAELGVRYQNKTVVFDDTAPQAALRRAMVAAP
ncbi:MAG: hypothetical protein GWP91_23155 [Rhodobacterales bacterium]|nr:hypothetical protein [Rhodobacterales bacterium]